MAIFSTTHILIILTLIITPIIIGLRINKNILKFLLNALLLLEIFKIIFLIITNNFQLNKDLPIQLCYIYPFIGLIYLTTKKEFLLNYLGPFGILFSIAATIFTNPTPFFSFTVLYSYFYHALLLITGIYITKNYKTKFSFKTIVVLIFQIVFAYCINFVIQNGANYVFLNTFLDPAHSDNYIINVEVFKTTFFNTSINKILVFFIKQLGLYWYIVFFILFIISFSTLWVYVFSKKKSRHKH